MKKDDLILKRITDGHLSIPDRQALPNGQVRFSLIHDIIKEALRVNGWFPHPLQPGDEIGEGAFLELRGSHLWLHEQHESGVGRFGPIQSTRKLCFSWAVRSYLKANCGLRNGQIDGVAIDWHK